MWQSGGQVKESLKTRKVRLVLYVSFGQVYIMDLGNLLCYAKILVEFSREEVEVSGE